MELHPFNADLHIHSRFSGATSSRMNVETIARQARLKGLKLVGTGDIFHPLWRKEVEDSLEKVNDGTLEHVESGTVFLLTTEIEDINRVHHLIIFPSLSAVDELREKFSPHSPDIDVDGRATIRLSAPEIVEIAVAADCLIGPAHAFTPWTSLYKEFDSLASCYKEMKEKISFLELGLSADSDMADRITELQEITFLSCSDAHSPWPDKLGREFNRMELLEPTFEEVRLAVVRKEGRQVSMNVGFDPRLGKYHRTACSKCFAQHSLEEAKNLKWRCRGCGGWIKKGVWDRVNELANHPEPKHPPHRPPYLKIAPLVEILALSSGKEDPHDKGVQELWWKLVTKFGDEISVLVNVPLGELKEVGGGNLAEVIKAFREGSLRVVAGGGGKYGHVELPWGPKALGGVQKQLTEF